MPHDITLNYLPLGYAVSSGRAGEMCDVRFRDFLSTEDGQRLIDQLEGVPAQVLEKISGDANSAAAKTDSLLAVIRPDRSATVYWNEFHPTILARAKGPLAKGELVMLDHLIDVEALKIPNGMIPADAGFFYVFSFGWRRGLFFDFGPLIEAERRQPREYDLEAALGYSYARLLFQHVLAISDATWMELFRQGWFPFSHLGTDTVKSIARAAEQSLPIDDYLDKIADEVAALVPPRLIEWRDNQHVSPHLLIIETAYERYMARDYISAASILYPRLEGIIRTLHAVVAPSATASQAELSHTAAGVAVLPEQSLLLPRRFQEYLRSVYFGRFTPGALTESVSRNSISHGVVLPNRLDRKAATIGFLMLLQLLSAGAVQLRQPR